MEKLTVNDREQKIKESSASPQKPEVLDLGPVGQTKVHEYQRLFIAILVVFGFAVIATMWWRQGYIGRVAMQMGTGFTVAFAINIVIGVSKALWDIRWMSRGINILKSTADPREKLERMFKVEPGTFKDNDLLRGAIERNLGFRVWFLSTTAVVATLFGILGTMVGMAEGVLPHFAAVQWKLESIQPIMPKVMDGFAQAMQTTVVGLYIWFVLTVLLVLLKWTKLSFEMRVLRVFSLKA